MELQENDTILTKLHAGISQPYQFPTSHCDFLEYLIQQTINLSDNKYEGTHLIDRGLLRNKYFYGERYTYGLQMQQKGPGMEKLYPAGLIPPIPIWMHDHVIKPLIKANVIKDNFINSAVINEYYEGGCIVSHIDPVHIFDRPIVSVNLVSDCALCFGCKFEFKPIRCTKPVLKLPLQRGIVTLLRDFAANDITHCVRPEDTKAYRTVIILRRVLPHAPRLLRSDLVLSEAHSGDVFKKFYEKYSKSLKGSKCNYGGISKIQHGRKTFFADNRRYMNKPYYLKI